VPDGQWFKTLFWWTLPLLVPAIALGLAAWGASALASDTFAEAPRLFSPGTIVVMSSAASPAEGGPLSVSVQAFGNTDQPRTSLNIAITKRLSKQGVGNPSDHVVIVFLCGRMAHAPKFVDNEGKAVTWSSPNLHAGEEYNSLIGDMSACVYSRLVLSPSPMNQALLLGSSGPAPASVSGYRVLYALPGVVSLPFGIPLGALQVNSLPQGSTAVISLLKPPSDLQSVVASPQLPDTGRLQWKVDLESSGPPTEYRVSGTLQDRESSAQYRLFLSGALIGVAGGAFVWLLELLVGKATARWGGSRRLSGIQDDPDSV